MAGITLNLANALAAARDLGAQGWAASEMLMALRIGMAEGIATRGRVASAEVVEIPISIGV